MDISVIVPIYNVESYLAACLESINSNTRDLDAEVLLIDDGSTDGSSAIARTFAEEHRGFTYHHKENGGLSHTRNYGIDRAKGDYLSFIDSDDVLANGILPSMLKAAKTQGADLVTCDVGRLHDDGKVTYSPIHVDAFSTLAENVTNLSRHMPLLYDSTSCNKLVSRDLFDRTGILFPEGYLYEDIPVTFPWYHRSNVVSVLRYTGYLWRVREAGSAQITQQVFDRRNLTDRLAMMERLLSYIDENVSNPLIRLEVESKFIKVDLAKYVYKLPLFEHEMAEEAVETIASFFERHVSHEALATSSLRNQQVYNDVLNRDLSHLSRVLDFSRSSYAAAPITRVGSRPIVSLPSDIFTIESRDQSNDLANSLPQTLVTSCKLENGVLTLRGYLSYPRIDVPSVGDQEVSAFLINDITGQKVPLECKACPSPQLTADKGLVVYPYDNSSTQYCYDGCGFVVSLPIDQIDRVDGLEGNNSIIISYANWAKSGFRILRGTNRQSWKEMKEVAIEGERYYGGMASDRRGTLFLSLHDGIRRIAPSVYESNLEPEKVSVIILVASADAKLEGCLDSVVAQSHLNLEIILVGHLAADVIDSLRTRRDERLTYISLPQGERATGLNRALDECTGDYVMFVGQNDILSRGCVSRLLSAMKDEQAQMAICKTVEKGDSDSIIFTDATQSRPTILRCDEIDFTDGWRGQSPSFALLVRTVLDDVTFDPDLNKAAFTLALAQAAIRSNIIAMLDEILSCTVYENPPHWDDKAQNDFYEALAWERVMRMLEDGPTLARESAETVMTITAIAALKEMAVSDYSDSSARHHLLSLVRGRRQAIDRANLSEHDKRMLELFVTFPKSYLGLYGLKNLRR